MGNPSRPGILEVIIDWPESKDFGTSSEEEIENLVIKVHRIDSHVPESWAAEEHQNNQQVDRAAKIGVAQVDLDWQHKGELLIVWWAHDTSGHQGRNAPYRWAHDQGVDLTMDTIAQAIHECETCTAIKQAKQFVTVWARLANDKMTDALPHLSLQGEEEQSLRDL
ncbi:hypothetical protein llap_14242 [Limosa lapponica baueri]|uniref:Integrase zinc-binding domain-containing protein n=1 Tax=Limosa lapponica baueri TaxID=1758121 RepID=A0A2I0TNT9_LIMLA|nr:hypothetical protein llap_14242 [Limosa lapponica baueri]